ncbi:MAG: ABC transporter permease [Candidatus Accumulibacter sp.]|nr:ABC transporter permease [Accumulibacter sp.]
MTSRTNNDPTVIDARSPTLPAYWKELRAFREVLRMLIRRDLIIRFRQTYFGFAWLLFKPLMLMAVMTFAFGFLAGFGQNHTAPYPLVIFCGVIPWYFFSNAIPDSMNSLLGHLHVIQKTYFPRAIITIAVVVVDAIEFLVAWLLFGLGCIWYGYLPGWQVIFFPLFCLQLLILCALLGLWLAVLNVQFRDIGNLVPFLMTIGFFVSPIGYTSARIPDTWQTLYIANPLVGIVEGLRWSLLRGMDGFPHLAVLVSLAVTFAIGVASIRHFLATENRLGDLA